MEITQLKLILKSMLRYASCYIVGILFRSLWHSMDVIFHFVLTSQAHISRFTRMSNFLSLWFFVLRHFSTKWRNIDYSTEKSIIDEMWQEKCGEGLKVKVGWEKSMDLKMKSRKYKNLGNFKNIYCASYVVCTKSSNTILITFTLTSFVNRSPQKYFHIY
jgi:hypothetical protein